MKYGWANNRLVINLTNGKIRKEPLPRSLAINFIGGRGINSRTLYDLIDAETDPLGPENVLLFAVGPLTGTLVPGSGRYTITALSPSTVVGNDKPCFGDSNSGGFFGPELKSAGYDQIIITGKSSRMAYLWIDDDSVAIQNATHIKGKDTWETDTIIKEEVGDPEVQTTSIGPAGENLCRNACIVGGGKVSKGVAGKCGIGTVMGSKNLKAVAVRGSKGVKVAKPQALEKAVLKAVETLYSDSQSILYSKYGTASLVDSHQSTGRLPTKNYQETQFDGYEKINAEALEEKYWTKSKACFGCPLHCRHYYKVKSGPYACEGEGPEYVTLGGFGSKCGNSNLESILYANTLCNKLGLDHQGASTAIAWAMECWQRGILNKDDTDGLVLEWGNPEIIIELIRKIVFREGIGNILAEGAYRAAKTFGKGSEKYVMHAKGQDPAITDPRAAKAWGLGYAVSSRGGDHLRALPTAETFFTPKQAEKLFGTREAVERSGVKGKGRLVKWSEDQRAVTDSLEMCKFVVRTVLMPPKWAKRFFNAVTGLDYTERQMMDVGERIVNVERAINVRQGLTRKDDTLSERFLKEPIPTGVAKGEVLNLRPMIDEYYEARGWDVETGVPKRQRLEKLGLKTIARDLERIQKSKSRF
jgi:aldehyde:ferredoxin oxidoreductase